MIPKISKSIIPGMMYTGTVVMNEHPQGRRFIRIRFPIIDSEEIPDQLLPWSGLGRPMFRGGGNGVGLGSVPRVGSRISGFFNDGERSSFVAICEVDDPVTSTGMAINEWGAKDEAGTSITIKVGETLEIKHKGATVTINESGGVVIDSPSDVVIRASGDVRINGQNIYLND